MRAVGFPVAVQNAHELVKKEAMYVTSKKGGEGAVREFVEFLLLAQHKWEMILERYIRVI